MVAMNLFPSRGLAIHGVEIKVSRSDWLSELKKPGKSAPIQQYCDFWWLAAPKDVLKIDELPMTWGYLELQGSRLVAVKKAPQLTPKALDREFAAALIRRAGQHDAETLRTAVQKETAGIHERAEQRSKMEIEHRTHHYQALLKQVDAFEEASGIKIGRHYDGKRLGEGVRALFIERWDSLPHRLKGMLNSHKKMVSDLERALAEVGGEPSD